MAPKPGVAVVEGDLSIAGDSVSGSKRGGSTVPVLGNASCANLMSSSGSEVYCIGDCEVERLCGGYAG